MMHSTEMMRKLNEEILWWLKEIDHDTTSRIWCHIPEKPDQISMVQIHLREPLVAIRNSPLSQYLRAQDDAE
jgi:hypothetical protein